MKKNALATTELDYRPSLWLWILSLASVFVFAGLTVLAFILPSPPWQRLTCVALSAMGLLGLLDLARRRLKLTTEGVLCVSNFQSRFVARAEIDSVTWAKGAGVSLRLVDGEWVRLPELGRNSLALTNSIRSWLVRTSLSI